jgi:hypothetical protein
MLNGRRGSRPLYIRTGSVPVQGNSLKSPANGRRIASNGSRYSPTVFAPPQSAIMKRRRTRSPSAYARNTPRWTASPSPMAFDMHDRQVVRGTTPFTYATPHSNAPLQERTIRGSSVVHHEMGPPYDYADDDYTAIDIDMGIYQSGSEGLYDDDDAESLGSGEIVTPAQAEPSRESPHAVLPEDEPWPGIEDQEHLSDGENIAPQFPDHHSDASSQPSEYPSTQKPWPDQEAGEFEIHEDEDGRPGN